MSQGSVGINDGLIKSVEDTPTVSLTVVDGKLTGLIDAPDNHVIVKSLADFPSPIGNVITLQDNTTYLINGSVNIGINTIVAGVKNDIVGTDRNNDKIISTTTGTMFTVDSTIINKTILSFNEVTLSCINGTLLSCITSGISFVQVAFSVIKIGGTLSNCTSFALRNSGFSNITTTGFNFTGTNNGNIRIIANIISNNAGISFDLGTAIFKNILITNNVITENSSQTFLSGTTNGANVSINALVNGNTFTGVGNMFSTITVNDINWSILNNTGTANSYSIIISATQPTNPFENTIWIKPT